MNDSHTSTSVSVDQGVRWLATIGVTLLGVAAVGLGSARWDQFGPGARLGLLLAASAVAFAATIGLRRLAPHTSRTLDVLVAILVPADAAALVIVGGATWRTAIVAGGLAAVASAETLRDRGRTIVADLGTATGGVLACAGSAAHLGWSLPVLLSLLGLTATVTIGSARRHWYATLWCTIAGLTPALRVLDDAVFTGMGTFRDLGLLDAAELWETATAGTVAAAALVLIGWSTRRPVAVLAAVASIGAAGIQIWAELDPPPGTALVAVAATLVLAELALATPVLRAGARLAVDAAEEALAVIAAGFTLGLAAFAWALMAGEPVSAGEPGLAAAVMVFYWLVADLRRSLRAGVPAAGLLRGGSGWHYALPGVAASVASAVALRTDDPVALGATPGAIRGWTAAIRAAAAGLDADAVPVFLGGDHALAIGSGAAMAARAEAAGRPLHVLWLDAHSDYNTPATSPSGNVHGMPVAALCGEPELGWVWDGPPPPVIAPARFHMFGIRSVDREERRLIAARGIDVMDMRAVDEMGVARLIAPVLEAVAAEGAMLHVSLDVDFLDPAIAPGVGTAVPGGATYREAHLVMEMLADSGLVTSLDLVELNPFLDDRGKSALLLVDLAASLFGRKIIDRPRPVRLG